MKVLFFILGSIQSRIVNWGLDNMKELLDQDIVFFGPIEEKEFNIGSRKFDLISFNKVTTISEVFDRLPGNWNPDIVVCDVSTLNFIPDIYLCPVKTLLLGRDGWGDISFNKGLCEFFDFLSYGIIDRLEFKNYKTNLLPLLGMPVSVPETNVEIPAFSDRKIEVITISSYTDSFYHDRQKTMYNLSTNTNLNIKYYKGIKRNKIHSYYKNSKIVLDWAHTLSNRSYEASHNGCLLFSHESNHLMKSFWKPFVEYIPYNDENLIDLVNHYLSNPDQSEVIIQNMQKRLKEIPQTFGGTIVEHIKEALVTVTDINERINRINGLHVSTYYHRISTGFYFYYFYKMLNLQLNWQEEYFKRINQSISYKLDSGFRPEPLIEAARMAFLLNDKEKAFMYLNELSQIMPDYPWTYYMLARLYFNDDDYNNALDNCSLAISSYLNQPNLIEKYQLPFSEHKNNCDGRRVVSMLWGDHKDTDMISQSQSFLYLAYTLEGDTYAKIHNVTKSSESYQKALIQAPLDKTMEKFSLILNNGKEYDLILTLIPSAINDSPYSTTLHIIQHIALVNSGQKRLAILKLKQHLKSLKSFKNNKRIEVSRMIIKLLLLLANLNVKPNMSRVLEKVKPLLN